MRILTTNLRPDAGRATVLGVDVVANPQAVRERIGLAGQYAAVDDNLTGRENLRLVGLPHHQPRKPRGARADELLEQFGLSRRANRTAKTYSGGMRRRLDLAARSSTGRRSSSSTSRRPVSIPRVAPISGA